MMISGMVFKLVPEDSMLSILVVDMITLIVYANTGFCTLFQISRFLVRKAQLQWFNKSLW